MNAAKFQNPRCMLIPGARTGARVLTGCTRGRVYEALSLVRLWRVMFLLLPPLLAALVTAPEAVSVPREPDELPPVVKKYVPGSQEWAASPWMTAPSCRDDGGDFSVWVVNVIGDSPELLKVFNAELFGSGAPEKGKARNDAILAGYRGIASEMLGQVPSGYCVSDMKRWAGEGSLTGPFGFDWGMENASIFSCTDVDGKWSSSSGNSLLGADRAPCDGFHIRCESAIDSDRSRCEAWNAFSERYVQRVHEVRARAINTYPAVGSAAVVEKTPTAVVVLTAASALTVIGGATVVLVWRRRRGVPLADKGARHDTDS